LRRLSRLQLKVQKVKDRLERLRKHRDPNYVNSNIIVETTSPGQMHSNIGAIDKNRKSRNQKEHDLAMGY